MTDRPSDRAIAPWPDFLGQTIRNGDRMSHLDGTEFVVVHFPEFPSSGDAWRAVYCTEDSTHVSRLCLQIGDKGQAFVIDAAAPEGAQEKSWRGALSALLEHVDRETCTHEETHRGGAIWTICDSCGRKWADDEGGFIPHEDAPAVAAARALLTTPPQPPEAAQDREDAERYRWLRHRTGAASFDGGTFVFPGPSVLAADLKLCELNCAIALDDAIDAARAAGGGGE